MPPTPDGHHLIAATCPHCDRKVGIPPDPDRRRPDRHGERGSQLKLRARSKPVAHDCEAPAVDLFTDPDDPEPDEDDDPEPVDPDPDPDR